MQHDAMFDPCEQERRVLIVDDNEAIHDDFRKVLTTGGSDQALREAEAAFFGPEDSDTQGVEQITFNLTHAFSGKEGLACVQEASENNEPIDMAFVDMRMPPGWDGLKTIDEVWKVDPELEIVICSAYSDHSWRAILEALGMHSNLLVLRKPFDNIEVLQMSLALTEKRHLSRVAAMKMQHISELVASRTHELQQKQQTTDAMLNEIMALIE